MGIRRIVLGSGFSPRLHPFCHGGVRPVFGESDQRRIPPSDMSTFLVVAPESFVNFLSDKPPTYFDQKASSTIFFGMPRLTCGC
ncbi:UNVERIFIED_ORG: hypothetical protein FNL38_105382 [Nocardia globerula]|uniref:Uncharacterized protein n=1 Tax=Nocardia globerula TaxID=1818 RepID=A0A652YMY8_NOCGL|nr:hypothetical protein SZ00_03591 [Rhodococcus sp. AD45]PVX65477.1 hypothetical protein C8E04_2776 [Rhodococcus globerulus]